MVADINERRQTAWCCIRNDDADTMFRHIIKREEDVQSATCWLWKHRMKKRRKHPRTLLHALASADNPDVPRQGAVCCLRRLLELYPTLFDENEKMRVGMKAHSLGRTDCAILLGIDLPTAVTIDKKSFQHTSGGITIRDSPIHGKGVFATKKIKKDRFITHFGHLVTQESGHIDDYAMVFPDGRTYTGNPLQASLQRCGFMCNDASTLEINFETDKDIFAVRRRFEQYMQCQKYNVSFLPEKEMGALFAIRDIAEGEELFLRYGCPYWYTRQQLHFSKMTKTSVGYLRFLILLVYNEYPCSMGDNTRQLIRRALTNEQCAQSMFEGLFRWSANGNNVCKIDGTTLTEKIHCLVNYAIRGGK